MVGCLLVGPATNTTVIGVKAMELHPHLGERGGGGDGGPCGHGGPINVAAAAAVI